MFKKFKKKQQSASSNTPPPSTTSRPTVTIDTQADDDEPISDIARAALADAFDEQSVNDSHISSPTHSTLVPLSNDSPRSSITATTYQPSHRAANDSVDYDRLTGAAGIAQQQQQQQSTARPSVPTKPLRIPPTTAATPTNLSTDTSSTTPPNIKRINKPSLSRPVTPPTTPPRPSNSANATAAQQQDGKQQQSQPNHVDMFAKPTKPVFKSPPPSSRTIVTAPAAGNGHAATDARDDIDGVDSTDINAQSADDNTFASLQYSVEQYINSITSTHDHQYTATTFATQPYIDLFDTADSDLNEQLAAKNDALFDAMELIEDMQSEYTAHKHKLLQMITTIQHDITTVTSQLSSKQYDFVVQSDTTKQLFEQCKTYMQLYYAIQTNTLPTIYTDAYITALTDQNDELTIITSTLHGFIQLCQSDDKLNVPMKLVTHAYNTALHHCLTTFEQLYSNGENTLPFVKLLCVINADALVQRYVRAVLAELESAVKAKQVVVTSNDVNQYIAHVEPIGVTIRSVMTGKLNELPSVFRTSDMVMSQAATQLLTDLYNMYTVQLVNSILQSTASQQPSAQLYLFDKLVKHLSFAARKIQKVVTTQCPYTEVDCVKLCQQALNKFVPHVNDKSIQLITKSMDKVLVSSATLTPDCTAQMFDQWVHGQFNAEAVIQVMDADVRACSSRLQRIDPKNVNVLSDLSSAIITRYSQQTADAYDKSGAYYKKSGNISLYTTFICMYIHDTSIFVAFMQRVLGAAGNDRQAVFVKQLERNASTALNTIQSVNISQIQQTLRSENKSVYQVMDDNDTATPNTYTAVDAVKAHLQSMAAQLDGQTYDTYVRSFIYRFQQAMIDTLQHYQVNALGANLLNRNLQLIYTELSAVYANDTSIERRLHDMSQITCLYYVKADELKSVLLNTKQGRYLLQQYSRAEMAQLLRIRADYSKTAMSLDGVLNSCY